MRLRGIGAALFFLLPAVAAAQEVRQVNTASLNVRTGPGTSYTILGQAHQGEKYVVIETSGVWKRIWWAGNSGWFHSGYTIVGSGTKLRVTVASLNVRSGPGTTYGIVGQAHQNEIYVQKSTSGAWRQIWFGGAARWVHGNYVEVVADPVIAGSLETSRKEGGNSDENFLKTICSAGSSDGGAAPAFVLVILAFAAGISSFCRGRSSTPRSK